MEICTRITGMENRDGAFLVHTDCADWKIVFLTEEIVRIRASFDKKMEEESYVLMTTAWDDRLDFLFAGERTRVQPVRPRIAETQKDISFSTGAVRLVLQKAPAGVTLYDREGTVLYEAIPGSPFLRDSNHRVVSRAKMDEDDCFYGFGEKTGSFNKNKMLLRQRGTDALSYDPVRTDTLYKHIPFYIRLSRKTKKAVGVFYHNFYESVFNMGCEKSNYWPRYTYWQADGGDIDLFLLGGNSIARVLDLYTLLTGRPMLLPKRALGYQGSSMFYAELEKDSDRAVLDFIDTCHDEGFPIDGFHLSSGYTSVDGKRCVFTWNRDRFPDPEGYFAAMNARGAENVPNVKPGVLLCHPDFGKFQQEKVFVSDSLADSYAVGAWWGGPGAFWDYTNDHARRVWKQLLKEQVVGIGTHSVWNDNCEYDSLLDQDARCDFDGKGGTIGQLKPIMANLMCALSNEAVREQFPGSRPYTVCRAGAAGIQRYAQTWCGDNRSDWESLKYNVSTILGMGLSGQPNEGGDVGGFGGNAPSEELFLRWVQHGIFMPRFSIHSASYDNTVTEPWMYRGSRDLIRQAILLRYRMVPYLYSLEYEASVAGAPIMRPLVYEFQEDERVYDSGFDFLFGKSILVANVLEPGAVERQVYLPKGTKWYHWADHFASYEGGTEITVPVDRTSIPMFFREGAIVPMADNQILNMQRDKVTALHLILVPGQAGYFCHYEDDGTTENYKNGAFRKTEITMTGDNLVEVTFQSRGDYPDSVETVLVEMVKKERSPDWVELNGERMERFLNRRKFEAASRGWYYSLTNRTVEIRYANPRCDSTLRVCFGETDLIGM